MMQNDNDMYALWAKRIFGVLLALIVLFLVAKMFGIFNRNIGQLGGMYQEAEEWGP